MPYRIGKKKIFYIGEEGSGVKLRHSEIPQNFKSIRTECLKSKRKFEDPEFPTHPQSIGYIDVVAKRNVKIEKVIWRRPYEIVGREKPLFYFENDINEGAFARFDINQGTLGDCWFLVAIVCITMENKLREFVIPDDNSLDSDYCGILHFRFWHKGVWLDVVIDDRLPCIWNSFTSKYELIFMKSKDNEFWPALLEKAYAKLMGSYKIIEFGLPNEAMEDFTGGIWEVFYLQKDNNKDELFQTLLEAYERGSFIATGTGLNDNLKYSGLIKSHAYSVTSIKRLESAGAPVDLLRLRNPYGNYLEWRGAWGDNAEEWKTIDEEIRTELKLNFRDDGEFWIQFKDFQNHFSFLHVCHLSPETLDSETNEPKWKKWNCEGFFGSWTKDKFAPANQHFVTVGHFHEDEHSAPPKGTLIVALMNKNIPLSGKATSPEYGFDVYRVEGQKHPLTETFFINAQMEGRETTEVGMREVVHRFNLDPATYCIVPYCLTPDYAGDYLLRVVSEKQHLVESDHSCPKSSWKCCLM